MKNITLTNYEITTIVKALENPDSILYTDNSNKILPVSLLWKMDENFEKLRSVYSRIEKKRSQIEQQFADDEHSYEDTVDGQQIRKIKDKYAKDFSEKINEFMILENTIEINPVLIKEFDGKSLTPRDYRNIRFMLDNESEEKVDE